MSGTASMQGGSIKELLGHEFWKGGINQRQLIKTVLGFCKEEYTMLYRRLGKLSKIHLRIGVVPTKQPDEVDIVLEKIQSEFPALYDKDVENYEQRVHVTRRLIYIVHGDRRSSYSKSKAGRIEKKRETEMCKYPTDAKLTGTRTRRLKVWVEVPPLSSRTRSKYVMLGTQDFIQKSPSRLVATRRVRFYSTPRHDKTEHGIDLSYSLLPTRAARLSRLSGALQVSRSYSEPTATVFPTAGTHPLKFLSNHVLTEPPSSKDTPRVPTTTETSTDSELSEDVLRFLVSCQPRLAQFSRDFAAFGCTKQEHLLRLASWDKEMRRKVMREMLTDATDMEIELMEYHLERWSGAGE